MSADARCGSEGGRVCIYTADGAAYWGVRVNRICGRWLCGTFIIWDPGVVLSRLVPRQYGLMIGSLSPILVSYSPLLRLLLYPYPSLSLSVCVRMYLFQQFSLSASVSPTKSVYYVGTHVGSKAV